MRAMLSNKYAIVNNQWMMEVIQEAVPNGMLSHWRGDADTMYGNVLIPDSIREEDDSDYAIGGAKFSDFSSVANIVYHSQDGLTIDRNTVVMK